MSEMENDSFQQIKMWIFGIIFLSIGYILAAIIGSFLNIFGPIHYTKFTWTSFWFWSGLILSYIALFLGFYSIYTRKTWIYYFFNLYIIWSLIVFGSLLIEFRINNSSIYIIIGIIFSILLLTFGFYKNTKPSFEPIQKVKIKEEKKREEPKEFFYKDYKLFCRQVKNRGGGTRMMYFFSKKDQDNATPCKKPSDYKLHVTKQGVPYLKKQ